jgi:hypothetical protein
MNPKMIPSITPLAPCSRLVRVAWSNAVALSFLFRHRSQLHRAVVRANAVDEQPFQKAGGKLAVRQSVVIGGAFDPQPELDPENETAG